MWRLGCTSPAAGSHAEREAGADVGRHQLARHAPAGHVVVTRTVCDLVFGSEISFSDHDHDDGGLPGEWKTYLVVET